MKIFASDFALDLQCQPDHGHFAFEVHSLNQVRQRLLDQDLLFAEEVFFVDPQTVSVEEVVDLLKIEDIAQVRATMILQFADAGLRETFFSKFQEAFKPAPAAGGIVRNPKGEYLLIFRNGKWDLPKGKFEKGESEGETAFREVAEETALVGHKMGPKFQETYHIYLHKKKWRFKVTHWFHMSVDKQPDLEPQTEEGITEVRWWSAHDLRTSLPATYPQIEELIRDVLVEISPTNRTSR